MPSAIAAIAIVVAASLFGGGCIATPVPEPPATALNFGRIHGPEVAPTTNLIGIVGEPGAGPPGHTLRVTNLDKQGAPVDVVIAADGSFELQLAGDQEDELRFHTRLGRARGIPVDIVWAGALIAEPARVDCLELVPLQQQDFDQVDVGAAPGARTVSLQNDCAEAVPITAARLRRTTSAFALGANAPTLPADLAPGSTLTWTLELTPTEIGDAEEIFFLELTYDASPVRYPITLYGDGR